MPKTITISLPVADLQASKTFYTVLGFVNNPQCSGDGAALMVWSETISVMLLTHAMWRTRTTRPIPPETSSEVGLNISCDSRAAVDAMNKAAAENGGIPDINPVEDMGFSTVETLLTLTATFGVRSGWTCLRCPPIHKGEPMVTTRRTTHEDAD